MSRDLCCDTYAHIGISHKLHKIPVTFKLEFSPWKCPHKEPQCRFRSRPRAVWKRKDNRDPIKALSLSLRLPTQFWNCCVLKLLMSDVCRLFRAADTFWALARFRHLSKSSNLWFRIHNARVDQLQMFKKLFEIKLFEHATPPTLLI